MTGLELIALVGLFALFMIIPIGTYLEVGGESANANEYNKFIETPNTEPGT